MYLQTYLASIKINLDNLFSSKDLRFAWLNDAVFEPLFFTFKVLMVLNIYALEEEALFVEIVHCLACAKDNPSSLDNSLTFEITSLDDIWTFQVILNCWHHNKFWNLSIAKWGHNRADGLEQHLKAHKRWQFSCSNASRVVFLAIKELCWDKIIGF